MFTVNPYIIRLEICTFIPHNAVYVNVCIHASHLNAVVRELQLVYLLYCCIFKRQTYNTQYPVVQREEVYQQSAKQLNILH
jgi:hypothetical protein